MVKLYLVSETVEIVYNFPLKVQPLKMWMISETVTFAIIIHDVASTGALFSVFILEVCIYQVTWYLFFYLYALAQGRTCTACFFVFCGAHSFCLFFVVMFRKWTESRSKACRATTSFSARRTCTSRTRGRLRGRSRLRCSRLWGARTCFAGTRSAGRCSATTMKPSTERYNFCEKALWSALGKSGWKTKHIIRGEVCALEDKDETVIIAET